jgi:hypothetical protein
MASSSKNHEVTSALHLLSRWQSYCSCRCIVVHLTYSLRYKADNSPDKRRVVSEPLNTGEELVITKNCGEASEKKTYEKS